MKLQVKRIYDKAEGGDGFRILVDRLWPRGVSKENAKIDEWCKEIAPSDALRKWFGHVPERWEEFKRKYGRELDAKGELVRSIAARSRKGRVTLLYGAKDAAHNNAVALKEYIEARGGKA